MASTHSHTTEQTTEPAEVVASRIGRALYLFLGFVCLGLGIAGYIVPLLPGTVFLLLATFFFFKSNERMYNWVLNHPRFGPLIRNYRAGHGIPRRIKVLAIVLIAISFGISIVFVATGVAARSILIACALGVSAFILTRPTTEVVLRGVTASEAR
jgi:uncharacterized membrane protein YbaN (DUF454 family)